MALQGQPLRADALSGSVSARRGLRVCHIMSADLWAGAEVQVATVASYLVERPDVNLTAVLLNEGPLARELRRLGVSVTIVDETRYNAARILTRLTRFLRANEFEVVHTHRYKDNVLGAVAAKLAGVPHVIRTVHGLNEPTRGWARAKAWAYDALDRATLWCFADRIIAVSKRMAETLKESVRRPTAVIHIHNGVDLRKVKATRARDEVRRGLGIGSRALLIGTVGRLSPVKGHAYFLRAARLVLAQERDARFLVVGDGPLRDELVASAARLGVDRACLFLGPRTDVYDLVVAMDVFVLPSLDEGIPMALLEAMALGTPVVATAVGGIPEIVTHRTTGLLVKPRHERGLADACLELARDRDWAQTLTARARRVVEEEFSYERNGHALMEVYRHVIGAREVSGARRLLDYGRRKLDHAVVRREMNRIRRNPGALTTALSDAKSILIVCHGNIIRSAFAARVLTRGVGDHSRVAIFSGGLDAVAGTPAHPTAVLIAAEYSVDLRHHTATQVAPDTVAEAEMIFVMDIQQLIAMRTRFPEARAKTFLLTCLTPDGTLEIRDPVDGDESRFRACFDHISRAAHPLVRILCDAAQSAGVGAPSPSPRDGTAEKRSGRSGVRRGWVEGSQSLGGPGS
jgi:glycosyltransferase involved in cell wall biosynthesis/protein-tyrosine-phosphatase